MQPLFTYNVVPKLPAALEPLRDIVYNLWWTWEPAARKLFRHLDPELWHRTNHNPLRMLQLCRQGRLTEVATDDDFIREMRRGDVKNQANVGKRDNHCQPPHGASLKQDPVACFFAQRWLIQNV